MKKTMTIAKLYFDGEYRVIRDAAHSGEPYALYHKVWDITAMKYTRRLLGRYRLASSAIDAVVSKAAAKGF